MSKGKIFLLVALSVSSTTVLAAKERVVRVSNSVRVGHDDNIYASADKTRSGYVTDIVNISGKLTFSSRTDMLLYWQPEVRYRFDAENPKLTTYQDVYARLNHAISQRTFVNISDHLRYQDQEAKDGVTVVSDQNYLENDLKGAVDYTINSVSQAKAGAGYEFRKWDDNTYGTVYGNDYDQIRANGSYIRQLRPNTAQGTLGFSYIDHSYEGSRGGFGLSTIYGGVDHNFNPNLIGNISLGYSYVNIEDQNGADENTSRPDLQAGLGFNPTARTSLTGSMGYSIYRAQNSYYNAQDRFNLAVGARHDLTSKISISSSLRYILGYYDSDYAKAGPGAEGDAEDSFVIFSLRASYQINRNNFVDAGYSYSERTSDSWRLNEYDRNRVDIGWRLEL